LVTKMEVYSVRPSAPHLPLGGFMPSNDPVQVRNIDGLGPVKAEISSTALASGRGEVFQNATSGKRNIVLTLGLNPNWEDQTMSTLRQMLYAYLLPQQWTKLRFYSDFLPTCDIEGYVESFEPNMFSPDPEIQVSIICPKPDFIDIDATIFNGIVTDGASEVEFEYPGNVDTGFEMRIDPTDIMPAYTGPITIVQTAYEEEQSFVMADVTVNVLKYIKLTTVMSLRKVQNINASDGAVHSLLPKITPGSVWPQIKPGTNVISVQADDTGQIWTMAYFTRFGGL
jgi:Phage tail protein